MQEYDEEPQAQLFTVRIPLFERVFVIQQYPQGIHQGSHIVEPKNRIVILVLCGKEGDVVGSRRRERM